MNKEIATATRTAEILDRYDLYPKKNYGQNFIIDPEVVRSIAASCGIEGKTVLEIGPGIGALSEQLAKLAKHVEAYEIDRKLENALRDVLSGYDNIHINFCDFLKTDLKKEMERLGIEKAVFCANLPYYITTPILFHIIDSGIDVESMTFMVQKEMAERFRAATGSREYNDLSVLLQFLFTVKTVRNVPASVFLPRPKVDSVVIRFEPKTHAKVDFAAFSELVKACFVQRRKTISNNLKEYFRDAEITEKALKEAGIEKSERAQDLSEEDFVKLYEVTR